MGRRTVPIPFKKVFQRPSMRRILFPFTVVLFLLLIALAVLAT